MRPRLLKLAPSFLLCVSWTPLFLNWERQPKPQLMQRTLSGPRGSLRSAVWRVVLSAPARLGNPQENHSCSTGHCALDCRCSGGGSLCRRLPLDQTSRTRTRRPLPSEEWGRFQRRTHCACTWKQSAVRGVFSTVPRFQPMQCRSVFPSGMKWLFWASTKLCLQNSSHLANIIKLMRTKIDLQSQAKSRRRTFWDIVCCIVTQSQGDFRVFLPPPRKNTGEVSAMWTPRCLPTTKRMDSTQE